MHHINYRHFWWGHETKHFIFYFYRRSWKGEKRKEKRKKKYFNTQKIKAQNVANHGYDLENCIGYRNMDLKNVIVNDGFIDNYYISTEQVIVSIIK